MPRLRTRTVSTKVTEDDDALIAQLAGDLSVGEWVREVLFKAVLSERTGEAHRTILGALRKAVMTGKSHAGPFHGGSQQIVSEPR